MEKFRRYIDKKFLSYPKSRSLDELKEELIATLTERYQEYLSSGLNEDEGYQRAVESIGDCKETVNLIESGIDKKTKSLRVGMAVWASALYWLLAATIFLTVSLISRKWIYTWIIFPVAAAIYLCTMLAIVFPKGRSLGKSLKTRVSATLAFLIVSLAAYFLVSFFTRAWSVTWVTFLIGLSLAMLFDAAMIKKSHKTLFLVYVHLIVLFLTNTVYQLISYFGLIDWSLSWLIFLFAAAGLLGYNLIRVFLKYKSETSFNSK